MSALEILEMMGFPKEKAEYALRITNNSGVEPAMEWLLAHADEDIPTDVTPSENVAPSLTLRNVDKKEDEGAPSSSVTDKIVLSQDAKTLKCDTCGKILRNGAEAELHAVKTKHAGFSESTEEKKPLTDEERKEQLMLIEERLKQKRLEREEREKADALERERNRIKSGKGMAEAKRAMEDLEMKKIIDQRKRDKLEEKAARDRVRAQIEADKAARKLRQGGGGGTENIPSSSGTVSSQMSPTSPMSPVSSGTKTPAKDYAETRIQIRLQDGSTLQEKFSVKEQLSAVRLFIQMKTNTESPFGLMTSFPRKVFTEDDYDKQLDVLGLVPSAVIIMTKI